MPSYTPYPFDEDYWVPEQEESSSIAVAVKFMYAGAGLEIVGIIINVLRAGSLSGTIMSRFPNYSVSQVHSVEEIYVVLTTIGGLIGVGIWVWMARANAAGRGWARIVATLLFAINSLFTLLLLLAGDPRISIAAGLNWLIALCATAFLWRSDASRFYAQSRHW